MGVDAVVRFDAPKKLTKEDLKELSWNLGRAFGQKKFWFHEADSLAVEEDTDSDYPGIYEVKLWSRYYGPGYERGDFTTLYMLFQFLRARGYTVYYGGDSSDDLDLMDDAKCKELLEHWAKTTATHFSIFSWNQKLPMCPRCAHKMPQGTWSQGNPDRERYHCEGCGNVMDGHHNLIPKEP